MSIDAKGGARQRQRNGSVPRDEKAPRFNPAEFVQYELSSDEVLALKAAVSDISYDFSAALESVLDTRCGVKFSWDDYSSCWGCWVSSPKRPDGATAIISGRGRTPERAFQEAWFKFFFIFKGQHPAGAVTRSRFRSWDDPE
jgi:hypothetical protein